MTTKRRANQIYEGRKVVKKSIESKVCLATWL